MSAQFLNTAWRQRLRRRHWLAWITLCGALAIHVADEALTDFLAFYNPAVISLREKYPRLPLTAFVFETWLALLVFAVVSLLARSEEHTSELQSRLHLVCRLLLEKKNCKGGSS